MNPWDEEPKSTRKEPLEGAAQRELTRLLAKHGIWHVVNVGHKRQHRRGIPDILGVASGVGFGVELKRSTKQHATSLQRKELEEFAASGGLSLIAKGKRGAQDAIRAILGEQVETSEWLERVYPP